MFIHVQVFMYPDILVSLTMLDFVPLTTTGPKMSNAYKSTLLSKGDCGGSLELCRGRGGLNASKLSKM